MLSKSLLLIALTLFMISCSKDEGTPVLLYSNNFDDVSDLSAYTIGFGDIEISKEETINNSNGCLSIFGMCLVPNLSIEIGPFDVDYSVHMEAWIKSDYGAALHLSRKSHSQDYVRIETNEDLFKARKWNLYSSDDLFVPKGETLMLYVDASNNTLSYTKVDELKIFGIINE